MAVLEANLSHLRLPGGDTFQTTLVPDHCKCEVQCMRRFSPTLCCKEVACLCVHGRLTIAWAQQHVQQGQVPLLTSILGAVRLSSNDVPHAEGQQAEGSLVLVGLQAVAGGSG